MSKNLRKAIKYCRHERIHMIAIIALRFLLVGLSVLQPMIYANMINYLLEKKAKKLAIFMTFLIISYLFSQAFHFALKRIEAKAAKNINYYVKCKVTEYLCIYRITK